MNRRKFLKQSVGGIGSAILAAHPLELFLANVLSSLFQRAHAQSLDLDNHESFNEKKLISLSLAGGPSRWYWDLPLKPNGDKDSFSYGPSQKTSMLITKLNQNPEGFAGYLGEYATFRVGDYFLPYLWSGKIATPNGGSANMSELARNLLMIRGIHTINNHEVSRRNMLKPSNYASMGGLLADQAKTPVPAIATPGNEIGSFKSRSGTPQLLSDLSNTTLDQMLNPFNKGRNLKLKESIGNATTIDDVMNYALNIMKTKSGEKHRSLPTSYEDRIKAKKMLMDEYTKLTESFNFLSSKYTTLIKRSFGEADLRLAGCDNLSIMGDQDNKLFRIEDKLNYTGNLLNITDNDTTILNLAEAMAVAEFMITGSAGSTNDFKKSFSSFVNMTAISRIKNVNETSNKTASADAHFVGSYTSLVLFSRYYRAIASCLYEFKNQLASKKVSASGDTLFDRSVLTISSEFSRDAKDDGSGSDHGYQGAAFSILSGMIEKTMVFGDIKEHSEVSGKTCTWGYGAPMSILAGQPPAIGNAASTVTTLLGLPQINKNNSSFVKLESGKAVSAYSQLTPKNVKKEEKS